MLRKNVYRNTHIEYGRLTRNIWTWYDKLSVLTRRQFLLIHTWTTKSGSIKFGHIRRRHLYADFVACRKGLNCSQRIIQLLMEDHVAGKYPPQIQN